MKPIVKQDVIQIIHKFNFNKNAGHDTIGNYIIKRVGNEIIKLLTSIFNVTVVVVLVLFKIKPR